MLENLIIRKETESDYKKTELMAMRSFWNKYWPGCTEHLLIRIIRDSADYIPEISRIAEHDGKIVGAVYYTKAWIVDGETKHEIATFGPLVMYSLRGTTRAYRLSPKCSEICWKLNGAEVML